MTPAAVACDQKCVYCWRVNEMFSGKQDLMEYAKDDPADIVQGSIEGHLRKDFRVLGKSKRRSTKST